MPQKIVVTATFMDKNGRIIKTDKAEPIIVSPGQDAPVSHPASMTSEDASRIVRWLIAPEFLK
jgi:hypothetical protein